MSFSHAKAKALREESLRRGELASPATTPPAEIGGFGGEDGVGGSDGGVIEFLTPGGGAASSVVDSVDEMFSDEKDAPYNLGKLSGKPDSVKLVFPRQSGSERPDETWDWNLCGGLIGGPRGNRFCTKAVNADYPHCGVASHAMHKAKLDEGCGYIPSVNSRSGTESAFLEPCVSATRFPSSINDLAEQALSHEEWIAFLTYLPDEEDTQDMMNVRYEATAEALEKSKLMVSFAITPANQKPKLTNLVSRILNSKSAKNLEDRFRKEDDDTDKVNLSFEHLEAPVMEEGSEYAGDAGTFSPSIAQWNSLVRRVETLTEELGTARKAVSVLAEVSDDRFNVVDGQVINLRGSIGGRPLKLGPNLPALDLWSNVAKLSDEVVESRELQSRLQPTPYETLTRSLVESTKVLVQKQAAALVSMNNSKAEYVGQVKPLEAVLEDMTLDLYSQAGAYNKLLMKGIASGSGDPGHLKSQVSLLADQVKTLTGADLGDQAIDASDPVISSLKEDVARLIMDNQTIKASLGGEIVRIDQETFHSAEEVKKWIVDCVGTDSGTYEFFFDVTSMLESLQDSGRTSDETLDSQALSRKANHRSVSAARMLNSFGVAIPQVMNKKNSLDPFSVAPTYEKWKSHDGRSGIVESIRKSLQLWETRTGAMLATRFASSGKREVLLLARNLMKKSMAFWSSMCNWIDEFYGKLTSKTEAQKPGGEASLAERKEYDATLSSVREEAWRLVINVLTDIFQELALRRADGQAASDMSDDPPMQSAIVLYSALKAHKFMDELVERRFERHPVMAPTFNGFLFSERASHGDIKRLEVKLTELNNLTRNLQSKVDKK
jgi:hypothetical protein